MLDVNAFPRPKIQTHLTEVVTADARNQTHLGALASRSNGCVAAFAAGQAFEAVGHLGLSTQQGAGNVGNQVHIPAGHADHSDRHQLAPGVP
jgi:hypothetical protein